MRDGEYIVREYDNDTFEEMLEDIQSFNSRLDVSDLIRVGIRWSDIEDTKDLYAELEEYFVED